MHPAFASPLRRWLYAFKPASWPKVLAPALLGQVLGAMSSGTFSVGAAVVGLAFAVFATIYVVLLNDWFDADVDALKRRMFPEAGSPKTIPDAILPAESVLLAGAGFGVMALAVALCGELFLPGRPGLMLGAVIGLGLLLVYSAPPLRLNDRGAGEFVEALGVGVLVPWWSAYAQSGQPTSPWYVWALPGLALLAFASAAASGLSDEESDRRGGKSTLTTMYGNRAARRAAEYSAFAGLIAWMFAVRASGGGFPLIPVQIAVLAAALPWRALTRESPHALTNCFKAQSRYKTALHRLIWGSSLALALALVMLRLAGWA
ncbi:chlorophyll synthase [Nannocystis exedens]|uniref:Chlorophyll synthase n=1 Tax=Nannocystis exedens TaxID=54 RepID=A0A1I2BYY1_9BACT|nr:prenyltransferase [Nannocystis exedens]PCC71172.1 octaprenyltransferase [Nannocystis exedens]SFE61327.1 chlorophyll synthase [Nannocystis exedens]